jgi:hypothetical protein
MQYGLQKSAQEIGQSQYASNLAEQQKEWADKTAIEKMQIALQSTQFEESRSDKTSEFNANLSWTKELSAANEAYNTWSTNQSQQMAQQLIDQKNSNQAAANAASAPLLASQQAYYDAMTANLNGGGSSVESPGVNTPTVDVSGQTVEDYFNASPSSFS